MFLFFTTRRAGHCCSPSPPPLSQPALVVLWRRRLQWTLTCRPASPFSNHPAALRTLLAGFRPSGRSHRGPGHLEPVHLRRPPNPRRATDWIPRREIILGGDRRRFTPYDRFAQFRESEGKRSTSCSTNGALRPEKLQTLAGWRLSEAELARTGEHPELGRVTLGELLATWVAHDLDHVVQVRGPWPISTASDRPWHVYLSIMELLNNRETKAAAGEPSSRSVSRVKDALRAAGITADVVELPQSTRTSAEAARAIGCTTAQIAKSVVFRRADTGGGVIVMLRGVDRVDTGAVAALVGSQVERAAPAFVREATGFVIGGVPPLGHATLIETLMDEALLQYDVVWAAAGTPNAVFSANPRQLVGLATVCAVAERDGSLAS